MYDEKWLKDGSLIDDMYAVLSDERSGECSGSPVVTKDGKVLSFHTASFDDSEEQIFGPELTASNLRRASKRQAGASQDDEAALPKLPSEFGRSQWTTNSHANHSHSAVISKLPNLMACIRCPTVHASGAKRTRSGAKIVAK
jgi:hypothetical protein